jgi:hypothetical protein
MAARARQPGRRRLPCDVREVVGFRPEYRIVPANAGTPVTPDGSRPWRRTEKDLRRRIPRCYARHRVSHALLCVSERVPRQPGQWIVKEQSRAFSGWNALPGRSALPLGGKTPFTPEFLRTCEEHRGTLPRPAVPDRERSPEGCAGETQPDHPRLAGAAPAMGKSVMPRVAASRPDRHHTSGCAAGIAGAHGTLSSDVGVRLKPRGGRHIPALDARNTGAAPGSRCSGDPGRKGRRPVLPGCRAHAPPGPGVANGARGEMKIKPIRFMNLNSVHVPRSGRHPTA